MRVFKVVCVVMWAWLLSIGALSAEVSPALVTRIKNFIVLIETTVELGAYIQPGSWQGTGFVVDARKGIVVTNAHVAPASVSARYRLTFEGGEKVDATFLYADPWHDFAFLRVDPATLPKSVKPLALSGSEVRLDERVLICGNNEGNPFSVQEGIVTDLYTQAGYFPGRAVQISLNVHGGSSGSPILSAEDGHILGLNFAGSESSAIMLPIGYIRDALAFVEKGQIPPRYHVGVLSTLWSLDDAVKFVRFPPELRNEYRQKFPRARSRALVVGSVLKRFPAEGVIEPGDILWKINGRLIGPDLYAFDRELDAVGAHEVDLTVVRNGVLKTVKLGLQDLQSKNIQRVVSFGGAYFYEPDDYVVKNYGLSAPVGRRGVFLSWTQPNSAFARMMSPLMFHDRYYNFLEIIALDGEPVHDLDDLMRLIPHLMEKKNFPVQYVHHWILPTYNNEPMLTDRVFFDFVEYTPVQAPPALSCYDPATGKWETQDLFKAESVLEEIREAA